MKTLRLTILLFILSIATVLSAFNIDSTDESIAEIDLLKEFKFNPGGLLIHNSGSGISDQTNYNPNMRFPIKDAPAYCNSQVYGYGGSRGEPSQFGWKDTRNYEYPWSDNFCEKRNKFYCCPGKKGHQGQDIRPAGPEDKFYIAVASDNGQITNIGNYSVWLRSEDGRIEYRYLHLDKESLMVVEGQKVRSGDPIGFISNEFNGLPTTVHLHFEMRVTLVGEGSNPRPITVSPYTTLISSYAALLSADK